MTVFSGKRGTGKTTRLVKMANDQIAQGENVVFIVMNKSLEDLYWNHGLDRRAQLTTLAEYQANPAKYGDAWVLVDEAEWFLQQMFKGRLIGMTVSSEDMVTLHRTDWDAWEKELKQ